MKILHNIETIIHNLHVKFQKSHFNFLGFIDKILYFLSKRFIFLHIFHLIFRENGLRYGFLFFYNLSIIFDYVRMKAIKNALSALISEI